MSTLRYADVFLAPNLFRNGGFETGDTDFWDISSSSSLALNQEVDNKYGCRNFMHFLLSREDPTYIEHTFDFVEGNIVDNDSYQRIDNYLDSSETGASGDALRGCPLTSSASVRVVGGTVNIYGIFGLKDDLNAPTAIIPNYTLDSILYYSNFSNKSWERVTGNMPVEFPDGKYVYSAGFKFERVSGSPQVYIGNMQLSEGQYNYMPYTGCLFSKILPKGALVWSLANTPPPGFEKVSDSVFFVRSGTPGEDGGENSHTHEYIQTMRDSEEFPREDDWVRVELLNDLNALQNGLTATDEPDKATPDVILVDDGRKIHTHGNASPGGANNSIPLSRKYTLCRKK